MAKRKAKRSAKAAKGSRKAARPARKMKRSGRARSVKKKTAARKTGTAARRGSARTAAKSTGHARATRKRTSKSPATTHRAQLDRVRRTLEETVPTPPSSLDMDRHGSAARTGRAEMAESREEHRTMTPSITGGDVDADVENAYFSGDEAPGGDNPTPDQDIVDDIGKSLGVEYQDNEELRASDKVTDRDRHRWELDPASAEDYKDRK